MSSSDLPIPLGTLTGSPLLAGRVLAIQVRMQAAGSVSAAFRNEFSAAGINQALDTVAAGCPHGHPIARLYHPDQVSSEIAVADTVIVGGVPETYTYFSASPEDLPGCAEEYIMNNG